MFYYLYYFFYDVWSPLRIFKYITLRAAAAAVTSFLLVVLCGPWLIKKLKSFRVGENIRKEECPDLYKIHAHKQGTPTMGGVLIVFSILFSLIVWADIANKYILISVFVAVWLAALGFVDDYIKLRYGRSSCMNKRTKLLFQVIAGLVLGIFVYFDGGLSTKLYIPFLKNVSINLGLLYILFVIIVLSGSSNAVNLTDGLDGLAVGSLVFVAVTYSVLCYVSGNARFSSYLFIPFIPDAAELTILCAAIAGSCLGFLWFNCYPASVFMGDVGSLFLGGLMGTIAILIKKEVLLLLVGFVFVVEALSVILQVASFKFRKKRILKIAPLHHHFERMGLTEPKIIIRFWIVGAILSFLTLATLKIR
ncbi:MAG: phospho-N-acetylmuramoyl-pentapeptide-transferase [Candidatus Gygaella obscura]|nr:phospho-N-acetylmuramoyl-pentapeptide-transferase [Candidatus Gygaella obscura]